MLENLRHFFAQDSDWDEAEKAIVSLRAGLSQHPLAATKELAEAAPAELSYQYALWNGDYVTALEPAPSSPEAGAEKPISPLPNPQC